ncbi:MAG: DUF2799 domain-containing protein [Pseudomonadota bacterium]
MRYSFCLLPLLALSACASLSEDECRAGDWYQIGKADGAAGRQNAFLEQHRKACGEYGIAPNAASWARGRKDGLPLYCTPSNAFKVGRQGKHLSAVCPASQVAELERENDRGLQLNRVEQEIRSIESDIRGINASLTHLPADSPTRGALLSERSILRLDLLMLRTERARLL